jgi:hypothetical protein
MMTIDTDVTDTDDRIVQWHVQIARRADELARRFAGRHNRETDLRCWLEAEREILASEPGDSGAFS